MLAVLVSANHGHVENFSWLNFQYYVRDSAVFVVWLGLGTETTWLGLGGDQVLLPKQMLKSHLGDSSSWNQVSADLMLVGELLPFTISN